MAFFYVMLNSNQLSESLHTCYSYPKGQVLAFKLKKLSGDCDTVQNGGDKVDGTDIADKEGASNAMEKSSVGHKEKLPDNKKDTSKEKSDGAEELKRVDAGETAVC
jgi:lupus La protein